MGGGDESMNEQDYIDACDRVRVSAAKSILSEVFPENSSVIELEGYRDLMGTLTHWEEQLFDLIKEKMT